MFHTASKNMAASIKGCHFSCQKCYNSTIGFVGLGNMGLKMAQNLLNKGETLIVYDTEINRSKSLLQNNQTKITIAETIKDVAKNSKYVITMLPNNDSVMTVYSNEDGILKNDTGEGTVLIDCSTIDPNVSQKIWRLANDMNRTFLDAPVSGGVGGAEAGTLTFMVGGCETIPDDVKSLLLKMGSRVIHCGTSGMGQAAKICNNMLLGTTMVAVAESFDLGIKFGLDPKTLNSIINTSSGRCWASEAYHPVPGIVDNTPSNRDYQGGFKTNLLVKDMNLALKLAEKIHSDVVLARKATEMYAETASKENYGDSDFTIIYQAISKSK